MFFRTPSQAICNPDMNQQIQEALNMLGPRYPDTGRLGVLRVVISCPSELDDDSVENIVHKELDGHLMATVSMEKIVTEYNDLQALLSLRRKRSAQEDLSNQPKRTQVQPRLARAGSLDAMEEMALIRRTRDAE